MDTRQILQAILAGRQVATGDAQAALLPILREVQRRLGHLPAEVFTEIEARWGIPRHVSYSVASFYDEFRFDQPAKQ